MTPSSNEIHNFSAKPRVLVAGYFTTVGDYDSLKIVRRWLTEAKMDHDFLAYSTAVRKWLVESMDPDRLDPQHYSHLVIVCGPCAEDYYKHRAPIDLNRFGHCRITGINLSMIDPVAQWNPFDELIERDSDRCGRPDLTFLWERNPVPVVGLCVFGPQRKPLPHHHDDRAEAMLNELTESREMAVVPIDTRLTRNRCGQRTPGEIDSLFSKMDVVLTTRLHGLVYAIKNAVPAIAIDAVSDGAKVTSQGQAIQWPWVYSIDDVTPADLASALQCCLEPQARQRAIECTQRSRGQLETLGEEFLAPLRMDTPVREAGWSAVERRRRRKRWWSKRHRR